ncbi:MAG: hypothetical protein ACREP9_12745 [Candidatus Dormibacteraceae bacterium]
MTARPSSLGGPNWDETQLVIAELANLRAEIVKLTELQFQTTAATVLAFGTIVSVELQQHNVSIILIYPALSLILGMIWLHYSNLIARIATYIRDRIEDRVGHHNLGWEHYVKSHPLRGGKLIYWGIRPIFVISSVLALAASLSVAALDIETILLYSVAAVIAVVTLIIFIVWKEPSPELDSS